MNVKNRILLALEDGPMFPDELAEAVDAKPKTVKNKLSDLRKAGKVEDTGEVRGQSHQVRLAPPPTLRVPGVPNPIGDRDGDTPQRSTNVEIYEAKCESCNRYTEYRRDGNVDECLNCGTLIDFSRPDMTSSALRAERNRV